MITDSSWKYCIRIIFILCVIKELCYLISFYTLVSFKNCFLYLRGLLRTNNLRGITTKNVLLILHNCTRHVNKLWDKRNNDLTMIKTKLSPASQTSFLNLTIYVQTEYRTSYCRAEKYWRADNKRLFLLIFYFCPFIYLNF